MEMLFLSFCLSCSHPQRSFRLGWQRTQLYPRHYYLPYNIPSCSDCSVQCLGTYIKFKHLVSMRARDSLPYLIETVRSREYAEVCYAYRTYDLIALQ